MVAYLLLWNKLNLQVVRYCLQLHLQTNDYINGTVSNKACVCECARVKNLMYRTAILCHRVLCTCMVCMYE